MSRSFWIGLALLAAVSYAPAQERRSRIDVEHYDMDAEINPNTQSVAAKTSVRFTPLDDNTTTVVFELNNALNVSRVVDGEGRQVPASRSQQDFTVRLSFDRPLAKGQPVTLTFNYDGHLTGNEDSPVYGIRFAAIHPEYAYFMYPARWFPVSGYTTDRFSANMNITVPSGFKVLGSGIGTARAAGDKQTYTFQFERPSFPGSIAVVRGQGTPISSEGVTTTLFFRGPEQEMATAYGQEAGRMVTWFTGTFGLPPYANLTIVETENGSPNGYAAPGLIFLNPRSIGKQVSTRLLANQVAIMATYLPSFLLSDFVFPVINMPKVIQMITLVIPARYFIDILSGIYLRNLGLTYLWPSMLVLLIMFIILTLFNYRILKKEGL